MISPQPASGYVRKSLAELNTWVRQRQEAALEPELPILDAHHHLWDDQRGFYSLREFLEDAASGHHVVATVFVEVGTMYRGADPAAMRPVGEVEFVDGIAAMSASGHFGATRVCAGIVGHADLMLGDQVQPVLEALIAAGNGRLRGIRYGVASDPHAAQFLRRRLPLHRMLDPAFRRGFARVQELGLSFDAWQFHPQLPDLIDLLRAFPAANVILNHAGGLLGIPPYDGKRAETFSIWHAYIRELARFPNLSVKLGGLGAPTCGWGFHLRDVPASSEELAGAWRPYIETCIEAFGVDRCMMESNFPPEKQACGYGVFWNAMKRITADCSAAEKAALYRDTAARVYRLTV